MCVCVSCQLPATCYWTHGNSSRVQANAGKKIGVAYKVLDIVAELQSSESRKAVKLSEPSGTTASLTTSRRPVTFGSFTVRDDVVSVLGTQIVPPSSLATDVRIVFKTVGLKTLVSLAAEHGKQSMTEAIRGWLGRMMPDIVFENRSIYSIPSK